METPAAPLASNVTAPGRRLASPIAQRLADELGVDLSTVAGTGPGGRIVKSDVEAAARHAPEPATHSEPTEMRKAIAAAMTASAAVPQFALERDVDVELLTLRSTEYPLRPLLMLSCQVRSIWLVEIAVAVRSVGAAREELSSEVVAPSVFE